MKQGAWRLKVALYIGFRGWGVVFKGFRVESLGFRGGFLKIGSPNIDPNNYAIIPF